MDAVVKKIDAESRNGKLNSKYLFVSYVLCLMSAVFYSVTESSIIGILASALICVLAFFSTVEDYFVLIFGLQFLGRAILVSFGSSQFGFILFVYAVLFFKFLINKRAVSVEYLLIFLLLILDIYTSAYAGVFKIGDNINWVFSLLYAVFIIKNCVFKIDFQKLVIYFLLAQWTICIINILAEYRIFGKSLVPDMYGIYTKELEAFAFGKAYSSVAGGNGISLNNAMAIAFCIILFPYAKRLYLKLFYVLSILFLGYCGVMVISRGFYVELGIFLVLILLANIKKPSQFIFYLILLLIIAAFIYFYAYDKLLVNIDRVIDRFDKGNDDRVLLIESAKELLKSRPMVTVFGAGSYYPDTYDFTAHNIYFDSLVSLGIVGALIYWIEIIKALFQAYKKYVKFELKAFIPAIMLFVFKFVSGSTRDVGFYFYLVMIISYGIFVSGKDTVNGRKTNHRNDTGI